jgi:LysM repeat protein
MKWLFVLLLALVIFGGAAWFGYNTFVKEDIAVKKEQRGEVTPAPVPDISLPEFQAATQLRQEGKLTAARDALIGFIQKYPNGQHVEEAKDLLGETNVAILLSRYPSPEKTEYVVKSGDVLAKIARKLKTTPEIIMRMNNLSGTMLHIGEHLLISHPDFSMVIQRKARLIVLLNHGAFFKQYHVREAKLPGKHLRKSCRNHGLEGRKTRWHRQQGVPQQHAMDPFGRRGRLHFVFGTGFCTSQSRSAAAASGSWPRGFRP